MTVQQIQIDEILTNIIYKYPNRLTNKEIFRAMETECFGRLCFHMPKKDIPHYIYQTFWAIDRIREIPNWSIFCKLH